MQHAPPQGSGPMQYYQGIPIIISVTNAIASEANKDWTFPILL
jgi:hypothetical protein